MFAKGVEIYSNKQQYFRRVNIIGPWLACVRRVMDCIARVKHKSRRVLCNFLSASITERTHANHEPILYKVGLFFLSKPIEILQAYTSMAPLRYQRAFIRLWSKQIAWL